MQQQQLDLKIEKINKNQLNRYDIILFQNDIWRCESVTMQIFNNLDSKQQKEINLSQYLKVQKLELIPKEWKILKQPYEMIQLKGQELGMGQLHQIEVIGMKQFQQLDIVKRQKQRGKNISYKVILCRTKKLNCLLIVAVDLINNQKMT